MIAPFLWIIPVFLIGLLFSIGIFFILPNISGWKKLAKDYRVYRTPEKLSHMVSGKMGGVRYNGVLTVGISSEGLYLKPFFLFSLGHPPILLPWNIIYLVEKKKALIGDFYKLDIGSPRITTLLLPEGVLKVVESMLQKKDE